MNNSESGAKILNEPYCRGNEKDKCAKNLVVSLQEATKYIEDKFGKSTA